jgi:hypothetical protein
VTTIQRMPKGIFLFVYFFFIVLTLEKS